MHEFWYDYVKPSYQDNVKLCYIDTGSFSIFIKTEDVYEYIVDDVEKRLDTSNYESYEIPFNRPLPTGKNKKNDRINEIRISRKDYDRTCST